MPQTLSTAELRRQNRNRIYQHLYHTSEPVTKQAISKNLSLSLPTITQNFRDLMESGLIRWGHSLDSTGGRKPKTIEIIDDARIAIGIEITRDTLRLVVVDLRGNRLTDAVVPCRFSNDDSYFTLLSTEVERLIQSNRLDRNKLLGVGIAFPGILAAKTSLIELAPSLNIRKMMVETLTKHIRYPVRVENDATSGGRAETWDSSDQALRAYVSIGEGVGGCIMNGSQPYFGSNGRAGEFGHMRIVPEGRTCLCGQKGCFEAYCSATRLSHDFDCSLDSFFIHLKEGTTRYVNAWESYLDHLALGLNNIRMMLDCDIVLGGMVSQYLGSYLGALNARLRELDSFDSPHRYLTLSRLGAYSNATGAALAFIHDFIRQI
ncbi:MAG: ROK family protein [Eubacteriales bacterium]|nr:ROK family protein [Eubacteriales bacterium]